MSADVVRSSEAVLSIGDAYYNARKKPINSLDTYLTLGDFDSRFDEGTAKAKIDKIKESAAKLFRDYALKNKHNDDAIQAVIQGEYDLYVDLLNLMTPPKLLAPDVIRKLIFSGPSKTIENLATEIPIAKALTHAFVSIARSEGIPKNTEIVRNKIDTLAQQAIQMPFAAPYGQNKLTNEEFFSMRRKSIEVLKEIELLDCQFKAADEIVSRTIFGPISKVKTGPSSSAALGDGSNPFAEPKATPVPAANAKYVQGETAGREEEDEKNRIGYVDPGAREYSVSREPSPDPLQTVSAAAQGSVEEDPYDLDSPPSEPPPPPPRSASPVLFQAERVASGVLADPFASPRASVRDLSPVPNRSAPGPVSVRPLPPVPKRSVPPRPLPPIPKRSAPGPVPVRAVPPVPKRTGPAPLPVEPQPSVPNRQRIKSDYPAYLNPFDEAYGTNSTNPFDEEAFPYDEDPVPNPADIDNRPMTWKQIGKECCGNIKWIAEDRIRELRQLSKRTYVNVALLAAAILAGYLYSTSSVQLNGYNGYEGGV